MYRVFLVDDEVIILEGLKKVIEWEKFNCTICGTACDGQSGLTQMQELKPDILFTDISMPNMDGLAMLASLRSQMPQMEVTILTGYHDFQYAQEAIRLGVRRLLTKPSRMDELEEAIGAMTKQLEQYQQTPETPPVPEPEPAKEEDGTANSFIVTRAVAFIEEHHREKLMLQTVAEHCYVSQWHLSKLLNKYAGKNFYEILNAIRIKKATELLQSPDLRIAEVSERVGFADTGHFSRIFKKIEGVSANEYRNQLKK